MHHSRAALALGLAVACIATPAAARQMVAPWAIPPSDFGGAKPLNTEAWMTADDYPDEAVEKNQQGYVVIGFHIDAEGQVSNCSVKRSSGFAVLDAVPCRLITERARFSPAVDAAGKAHATKARASFPFWIPEQ